MFESIYMLWLILYLKCQGLKCNRFQLRSCTCARGRLNLLANSKLHFVLFMYFSQDVQAKVPIHLLHLKLEVEQSRITVILQDCRSELDREIHALSGTCTSERVVKEHRVSFLMKPPKMEV